MKKLGMVIIVGLFASAMCLLILENRRKVRIGAEFDRLLEGKVAIRSIEFRGQQRATNVTSSVIVEFFSRTMSQRHPTAVHGTYYVVKIKTENDVLIETEVGMNTDEGTFSFFLPHRSSAGDPEMRTSPFPKPIPPEVEGLLSFLTDTNLYKQK